MTASPSPQLSHCWETATSYSITPPGEEQGVYTSCINLVNTFQAWCFRFPAWKSLRSQMLFAWVLLHQCLPRKMKILSLSHSGHDWSQEYCRATYTWTAKWEGKQKPEDNPGKRHCDLLKEGGHLIYSLIFFEDIIMIYNVVIKCCTWCMVALPWHCTKWHSHFQFADAIVTFYAITYFACCFRQTVLYKKSVSLRQWIVVSSEIWLRRYSTIFFFPWNLCLDSVLNHSCFLVQPLVSPGKSHLDWILSKKSFP